MIPTEPIGSIPRPPKLVQAIRDVSAGRRPSERIEDLHDQALRDTIRSFEATGSPVITDGEQTKPSFATYPIAGMSSLAPDGVVIPFADGHQRQLPRLTAGPFRYQTHAASFLERARSLTKLPVKQAVISASALSLLYPAGGVPGYSKEAFVDDLLREAEADIRGCLDGGAHSVQIDFTEGRLSLKLDPSQGLLKQLVSLNNSVLRRFTKEERARIGVHTCPGGDRDSTHSADVDYGELLPALFQLDAGAFYVELAAERDRRGVLAKIREHVRPDQRVFVGVTNPIDPRVETAEEVRDRILEAAEYVPLNRLGTTDDCGFSPFADDDSTSRDTAFAKIRARVEGTRLASAALGVS
ncbi:MAG: cobalamin-independent methionine synthase II family protein [Acidobacteriota bacterium]